MQRVQETLELMAETLEGDALLELKSLAEAVADARVAALAGPQKARSMLEVLARRLDQAVLKGDLIIGSR